ncbi:hypothetical protein [Burkholderia gladioli]|uniref:hypothetical protein n=1 Tax=Burkholderia gladioli TaxID=28095 RepID=UPI000CFED3DA|nr:hypothetical protein [Burkholderia gladioli]PRG53434.1 hypothetical protein C6V06_14400 [Burkholderia gladioli]PRG94941.1 hypothetical protein C6V08_24955 [Burkholderia gladioli]
MEQISRLHISSLIGETLVSLQAFEQLLVAFLLSTVSESEADQKLEQLLLRNKETLGRLLKELSTRTTLPEHFAPDFDSLLEMRNVFIHRLLLEPRFSLNSSEGRVALDAFMKNIRAKLKLAIYVLLGAMLQTPSTEMSLRAAARFGHIIRRIDVTSTRDFGGLSEDAYIDEVVRTAVALYDSKSKVSPS